MCERQDQQREKLRQPRVIVVSELQQGSHAFAHHAHTIDAHTIGRISLRTPQPSRLSLRLGFRPALAAVLIQLSFNLVGSVG